MPGRPARHSQEPRAHSPGPRRRRRRLQGALLQRRRTGRVLYRGLADNSVGRVIESVLRADAVIVDELGFAPLDDTGAQLLFRFVAAAYERRAMAIGSHWPFEDWGRFLPNETTAVSLLDRLLHHSIVVVTDGPSFRMRELQEGRLAQNGLSNPTSGWGVFLGHQRGVYLGH